MKRKARWAALALCVTMMATVLGCGSTSSGPEKVGEVEPKAEANTEVEEKAEEVAEEVVEEQEAAEEETPAAPEKTEYHVGDVLKDGDVQIVYAASGEYKEKNEYSQPQSGNKYIFIRLAFENQGTRDESVSSFNFQCYADGYSAEQHYVMDEDISATLSSGRTTEGMIIYEVPEDAAEIEIEYETNFWTNEKIKFIYDGDADSGYVMEANTTASDSAFNVGDIIEIGDIVITYLACENDTSYDRYFGPAEGCHFMTLTLEFENKGSNDELVSYFDFDCYADGKNCSTSYFRDDALSATISAGRKAKGTVTFEVPDGATTVEAEYLANVWTSDRVILTVAE